MRRKWRLALSLFDEFASASASEPPVILSQQSGTIWISAGHSSPNGMNPFVRFKECLEISQKSVYPNVMALECGFVGRLHRGHCRWSCIDIR